MNHKDHLSNHSEDRNKLFGTSEHPSPEADNQDSAPDQEESDLSLQNLTDPSARIAELEKSLQEMKDNWIRAEADNQNIRARSRREVNDARQFAIQKFASDVVEAAENIHRALSSMPAPREGEDPVLTSMREGLDNMERSFLSILERNGIVSLDPTHTPFDANLHQAMAEEHNEDHPPGVVLQAWTPTWTLNGRLLKPAMVVISKPPTMDNK